MRLLRMGRMTRQRAALVVGGQHRRAEGLLNDGHGGGAVKRGHIVLQLLQLLHKLGRQHVHASAELLPHLDKGRACRRARRHMDAAGVMGYTLAL